jgi:ribosomal protein L17
MRAQLPPLGSKWKEVDERVNRTVEVIRYDTEKRRVRIACLETQKLTWAKPERFNGKSGGYIRIGATPRR